MNWFYADGGKQQGPIDEAQLVALIQSGKITQETLVWREGMAEWLPLRLARATLPPPPPPPVVTAQVHVPASTPGENPPSTPQADTGGAPPSSEGDRATCAECGKSLPKTDTVQYGTVCVCTACKPAFLDRIMGKAVSSDPTAACASEQDILARDYKIDIGGAIERAWSLFTTNPGTMIGASLIVVGVIILVTILSFVARLAIPGFDFLVSITFAGPLIGGYLWFLLRLGRGENVRIGDVFGGFSKSGWQLFFAAGLQFFVNLLCFIPFFVVAGITGLSVLLRGGTPASMTFEAILGCVVGGLVSLACVSYLNTLWTHSLLLIIDKGYRFWPAMELSRKVVAKRWWMTFLFLFVAGIISSLGGCACGIGLLITIPLQFAMKVFFYDDNFRDLAPADSSSTKH